MKPTFKLGRIAGIEVGLHYSWFIIAALITFTLAARFNVTQQSWNQAVVWITAATTAVLFFVTLLVHELSHALVARAYQLPVHSITLFALGGVANIEKEADSAKAEFWMGIVGPITSLVIGIFCIGASILLGWTPLAGSTSPMSAALAWLGYINIALAIFNMIPGFPLDGGRVLRAVIWWITGNGPKSFRTAARVGQGTAVLFMIAGIVIALTSGTFSGLWLVLIGWFLMSAATSSIIQNELVSSLKGVRAADAMSQAYTIVPADMPVQKFAEDYLASTWQRFFFLNDPADPDSLLGFVTIHDLAKAPKEKWLTMQLREIMVPITSAKVIEANTPVIDALQTMSTENVNQLPVMDENKVVGILTRANVVQLFQNRSEVGSRSA